MNNEQFLTGVRNAGAMVSNLLVDELVRAKSMHERPFSSHHEAYGVILEEVEEYWAEVKQRHLDSAAARKELIQVGAMVLRALIEL